MLANDERLIEARLQRWLTLRWRGERDQTDGDGEEADELLIDDAWLDGGTGSHWTQLVRRSGEGNRASTNILVHRLDDT